MSGLSHRVFGIRHHGPGSARRLLAAFAAWEPDCVLVEVPADAENELKRVGTDQLRPPVALVQYDAKDISRAQFLPFADFSPEWQAIRWANQRGVPVRAMDLPSKHSLAESATKATPAPRLLEEEEATSPADPIARRLRRDPLSLAAELAGYPDSEAWWDATLERTPDDTELFAAINELIAQLRKDYPAAIDTITRRREAYMRQVLRKAARAKYRRIAVVCGAWHGPALAEAAAYPVGADRRLLQGLPKRKVAQAWVPWSYEQIARESGYGAGVVSPAWYELLFEHEHSAVARWMVRAARLLRAEQLDASPAQARDALDLARNLAALRGHHVAGITELSDAALTTLAGGRRERLDLIRERLVLGTTVGWVGEKLAAVPLQQDLNAQIRSTRLSKYWETTGEFWLKATKSDPRGGLDLRNSPDRDKSILLHRLRLLGIPWGQVQEGTGRELGSFKEVWLLNWLPAYALRIIEAARWGNTVASAALTYSRHRAEEIEELPALTELIRNILRAELPRIVPDLIEQLADRVALSEDTRTLLRILPTLVSTVRYGDARGTDTTGLVLLLRELVPRIAVGLPAAADLEDEAATELLRELTEANHAVQLIDWSAPQQVWQEGLARLARAPLVHPLVRGLAVRLLFDQGILTAAATERAFHYALSLANEPRVMAYWLEGFLRGSGLLLLHHGSLWQLVDDWVRGLSWAHFEAILPLLRRTFANFSPAERRRLLAHAERAGQDPPAAAPAAAGPTAAADPTAGAEPPEALLEALRAWID
jgi:hypothetical protein